MAEQTSYLTTRLNRSFLDNEFDYYYTQELEEENNSDQQISNSICNSVEDCVSMNRITKCLQFYQSIDLQNDRDLFIKYFNEDNYPFLINDYTHLLLTHIGDDKPIHETRQTFEQINKFIMTQIKQCQLEKCHKLHRNSRNRDKQKLFENETDNNDAIFTFYVDILDTIHCYLIHSFDIGYRIRSNELQFQHKNDNYWNQSTDNHYMSTVRDTKMRDLKKILHGRRQKLNTIRERNKFITTSHTEKKSETKDEPSVPIQKSKSGCYSFGSRFYYWPKYKGLKDIEHEGPNEGYKYKAFYIKPKYDNLQTEVTNNTICTIELTHFNSALVKAQQFLESEHFKKMTAYGQLCRDYGIKEYASITAEHLLSLVLYTDFDQLSYKFSASFRQLNANETFGAQKRRNKEYAVWSKLLRETVEIYGTEMSESKIETFYHGVSKLIFSSFVCFLGSPTSTTAQLEVATVFAAQNGLILELRKSSRSLKYFNCNLVSTFGNEDERLFVGGLFPIQFGSIREMSNNNDYGFFIHALTSFNYSITGQQTFSSQHNINKNDAKIIKSLWKYYESKTDKFPAYINDIFKEFCKTKKIVKINQQRLEPIMAKFLFKKECDSLIEMSVFRVFVNLEKISVEYDLIWKPMLKGSYFNLMLMDLCQFESVISDKLVIELNRVEYDSDVLSKYKSQFEKEKWTIVEKGNVKNKSLEILRIKSAVLQQ